MREEETFQDLSSLFAAEDRALEAKPFVDDVMGKVRRRSLMRRGILLAVGGIGAVVAALQLPGLLGEWVTLGQHRDQHDLHGSAAGWPSGKCRSALAGHRCRRGPVRRRRHHAGADIGPKRHVRGGNP
jgi:hypothetical protein